MGWTVRERERGGGGDIDREHSNEQRGNFSNLKNCCSLTMLVQRKFDR